MTKKDYIKIADVLKSFKVEFKQAGLENDIINSFCKMFFKDNPKFDYEIFWEYFLK